MRDWRGTVFLSFLVLTVLVVVLFVVSLISPRVLPDWLNRGLILLGVVIAGAVTFLAGFKDILELVERFRERPEELPEEPLRVVTMEELRRGLFGEISGRYVNWIDRGMTSPGLLRGKRRVVIVGRMKVGKTREAVELIRRAVAQELVSEPEIYEPGKAFRFVSAGSLGEALRRKMEARRGLLFFVDNLPFYFRDEEGLERLMVGMQALQAMGTMYVLATARVDQLTEAHEAWLDKMGFERVVLRDLTQEETAQLVDNAAGAYRVTMTEEARAVFIARRDGTPELTLLSFQRLQEVAVKQIDQVLAEEMAMTSLGQMWAAAKTEICERRPEAAYVLEALAMFRAARVSPYYELVLAYGAVMGRERGWRVWRWQQRQRLAQVLAYLSHYDVVVQSGEVEAKDFMVEGVIDRETARAALGEFLKANGRWWRRQGLRRLNRLAEVQRWALFDLALGTANEESEQQINWYTMALQTMPHFGIYNNRGLTYDEQGHYELALADYNEAIRLNPEYATAYYNRGNTYDKQGHYELALADYNEAIRLNPEYATAYNNRGNTYGKQGHYELALADYNEAIRLNPEDATAYYRISAIFQMKGEHKLALPYLQKATTLRSDRATYQSSLAMTYKQLGDEEGFARHLATARELMGEEDDYNKACLEAIAGDIEAALTYLKKALMANPSSKEWAKRDPDFASLQGLAAFEVLVGDRDEVQGTAE